MNLMTVLSVYETTHIVVVNDLLKQNWRLLNVYNKESKCFYCLGKIK